MKTKFFVSLAVLTLSIGLAAQTKDFANWVNPFIGTGGHGHTFPGATMPFGMVQLSPDTRIDNWDGSSGYHYSDDTIYGFSHTHLNGTGIPDYCDILFMPYVTQPGSGQMVGDPRFFANPATGPAERISSKFSHAGERAEPGYYSVKLDDGVLAELTATPRVGVHRYSFPRTRSAFINIDLSWRDKVLDSEIHVTSIDGVPRDSQRELPKKFKSAVKIEGYRRSSSWAKDQVIYFVAEFSKNFAAIIPNQGLNEPIKRNPSDLFAVKGRHAEMALSFDCTDGQSIIVKVALSPVSIEGARKNLAAELPGWDFEKVRADARVAWNKELSKIEVTGGTDAQTTTFYTALYHTMIQPNIFNDVDGNYLGMDRKIHNISTSTASAPAKQGGELKRGNPKSNIQNPKSGDQYTVFSLWDTFRAAHPLYTIIDQKRTVDFINTFIRQYEQGGRLPVWELAANETDCMIGYHSVSVIADAMAKGIKGFDYEKAYAAAKHSAELDHFGLAGYKKRGYISMEDENESVSRTLEYAYDDWCIAQMARRIAGSLPANHPQAGSLRSDIEKYSARARYFENLFDPKIGFFRPKKNGGFVEPFAPNEVTFGFTEGNSWQYSFFVPQDVSRLMELMGRREKFVAKLDELFTTDQKLGGREQADLTGLIGQYAHGNEPSHHITYLYNYAGEPWKTQKYVRKIMDEFYKPTPDGLIGNEDCGQMSAWYIMSASGFYPVAPGDGVYVFGTPLFPEMTYRLENGKTFTIKAKNISAKNTYILNAKLNGQPYKKAYITHADLMKGGLLEFAMNDQPVMSAFTEFPVSSIDIDTVAVPVITGDRTFRDSTSVAIATISQNASIHFTTDGSLPTAASAKFSGPFTVDQTTTVKAVAIGPKGQVSFPVEAVLKKRPNDWNVKLKYPYSTQYTGGGDDGVIDGIRGTVNFASGEWQGYQGKPFEAVIDLGRPTVVKVIGASFLQVVDPWIWFPDRIRFEASEDGVKYTEIKDFRPNYPTKDTKPTVKEFLFDIDPITARYIRVRADNFGKIPSWHLGAGGDPWIFVDEVIIR